MYKEKAARNRCYYKKESLRDDWLQHVERQEY